jgi:hypothetical protein
MKESNKKRLIGELEDNAIDSSSTAIVDFFSESSLFWEESLLGSILMGVIGFVILSFLSFLCFCFEILMGVLIKPFRRKPKERPKPQEEEA